MALDGKTPTEKADICLDLGEDKIESLIKIASSMLEYKDSKNLSN